jgi:sulfur dioxygenase
MFIRQYFDYDTYTYTYLLADTERGIAALIDPVIEQVDLYLQELNSLGLDLKFTLDTHTHADHITAMGELRARTGCTTVLGRESQSSCVDQRVGHNEEITLGSIVIKALHTPGHTDDSYSFYVVDGEQHHIFTGDTLLIRGSGRCDFQNGDARQQYESIFDTLLALPRATVVHPGHDYRGRTESTIAEERAHNPRLQVKSVEEYVELMANLNLPNPKLMDVAVPANQACGSI